MRSCVFGAGAIGDFVAAHLARMDRLEVRMMARGAQPARIRERGPR